MFNPEFLNTSWGPAKISRSWQTPEDTILEALKEGENKVLDSVWKRVKNNQLSKLWEEVRI